MNNKTEPDINQIVRCKAMHANIEAMEYIINGIMPTLKSAHEKILYNNNDEAMALMEQIKPSFEALSALYKATEKLNTDVLQF